MAEEMQWRIYGSPELPALIYLPGTHGDWTLIGNFRRALRERVRFVEFTYPRTLEWSLEDYATAIEQALQQAGITDGWLLAESFGSQVAWVLLARNRIRWRGVILAGGFVRHPLRWAVRLADRIVGGVPLTWITAVLLGYARIARYRYRHSPETEAGIREFIARRTELDRQAATHRLRLIARNDPGAIATEARLPVFALAGFVDPIVPWWFVRRWLRQHCSALRDFRILWPADHNVLGTAPRAAAEQVIRWMTNVTN